MLAAVRSAATHVRAVDLFKRYRTCVVKLIGALYPDTPCFRCELSAA